MQGITGAVSSAEQQAFSAMEELPRESLRCARHVLQEPPEDISSSSESSDGSMLELLAVAEALRQHIRTCRGCKRKKRNTRKEERRITFHEVTSWYTSEEFRNAYRMSRETFEKLVSLLRPYLQRDEQKSRNAPSGLITPHVRVGVTLRLLAGGAPQDLMLLFRIPRSTVNMIFRETVDAINREFKFPGLPTDRESLLRMAHDFKFSRSIPNPLNGCVGAVDGVVIRIKKPGKEYGPRQWFNRKGYFAVAVQALVDSHYRVLAISALTTGSTHDSTAFAVSNINSLIESGAFPDEFWLAGDEAYVCTEFLIIPYGRSLAPPGSFRESFNFYHSSLRMHVEQVFGIVTSRWRILDGPLSFELGNTLDTIKTLFLLHNWCIDNDDKSPTNVAFESEQALQVVLPRTEWVSMSKKAFDLQRIQNVLIAIRQLEKKMKRKKKHLSARNLEKREALLKMYKELIGEDYDDLHREVCFKRSLMTMELRKRKILRPGLRKRSRPS